MGITSIQWTDRSLNPIRARLKGHAEQRVAGHYCEKVSPGCAHCYSSRMQPRFGMPAFGSGQHAEEVEHFLDEGRLLEVMRRREPARWFWCDMTDLFGAWVPDEWIDRCFATMTVTPHHTHQVLTKRPERMRDYLQSCRRGGAPLLPNVWCGTSVEDQRRADERIPLLLQTPAAVRFLSAEPLLGPVTLWKYLADCACGHGHGFTACPNTGGVARSCHVKDCPCPGLRPRLHWVIVGGESGRDARPMRLEWARSLVAQCREAGIACFVKQVGSVAARELGSRDPKGGRMEDWPEDLRVREWPTQGICHA